MAEIAPDLELQINLQLFLLRSSFRFSWSLGKTVSEKGCFFLNEIPFEIRENQVQKVSFCDERPLDFNFIDFGRPGSSVGDLFGTVEEGGCFKRVQEMGEGVPGAGIRRS